MSYNLFLIFLVLLSLFEVSVLVYIGERLYSVCIKKQYPAVSCRNRHIYAIAAELKKHYPNMKTAVDIGSGFGRLARGIAKKTDLQVLAIENMPISICVAKFMNFVTNTKKVNFIYADAFKYIAKSNKKFDIGFAYLGPGMNGRLCEIRSHFRILITLDAEIPGLTPTRIIDVPGGCTNYHHLGKFPNRLFIYETK